MTTELKCPRCRGEITRGDPQCVHCGVMLKWKNPLQKTEQRKAVGDGAHSAPPTATGGQASVEEGRAETVSSGAKFCPNCGNKLAGQKFCPECGAAVGGDGAGRKFGGAGAAGASGRTGAGGKKVTIVTQMPRVSGGGGTSSPRTPDYAAEERLRQEVKKYGWTTSGCFSGCLMAEVSLVVFLVWLAFPVVWVLPVLFVIAMAVASVMRGRAKARLNGHDLTGARSAVSVARGWYVVAWVAEIAMMGVHVWVLLNIVKVLTGIRAALGG